MFVLYHLKAIISILSPEISCNRVYLVFAVSVGILASLQVSAASNTQVRIEILSVRQNFNTHLRIGV